MASPRKIKLIVRVVGELTPSKYNKYPYQKITFKALDESDKNTYTLNLEKNYEGKSKIDFVKWDSWVGILKPGNVIEVTLQTKNPKNVDQWKGFEIIRDISKEKKDQVVEQPKIDPDQYTLGIQVQELEKVINRATQILSIIKEDNPNLFRK